VPFVIEPLENFSMKKKRPKKQAIDEELLPWMDYLRGDVVDGEFKAACQYEYARESNTLRRAAELFKGQASAHPGEISIKIENEFHCGSWFVSPDWGFIWQCLSFPEKGWNQLSEAERTELLYGLPLSSNKARPLVLGEVMFLTHYADQLKEMAKKAQAEWQEARAAGKPRQKVYPILPLPNTPFVQAFLPLDFSKTKGRLLEEIGMWLDSTENKARFDKHKPKTEVGTEKEAKDRLKDLAALRLYRELGYTEAREFVYEKRGQRRFHATRPSRGKQADGADLFYDQSGFVRAQKRARDYRAKLLPWEFGKFATNDPVVTRAIETFKKERAKLGL
jgi:hypothetical protein